MNRSICCIFTTLLLLLSATGCGTLGGDSTFASVRITGHTPEQIHAATAKVFREAGYKGAQISKTQLVFEKPASTLTTISRDGLAAAQGGARTVERVRTELENLGNGAYELRCQAFMVTGAGDAFFEDEVRKVALRSGPYKILLGKVPGELN